jgi:hypothetical protein
MPETLKQVLKLNTKQCHAAFGAFRAIVEVEHDAGPAGANLLSVASTTLELAGDWRALPKATVEEVAQAFPDQAARHALVDALVIPACIEQKVSVAGEAEVLRFAKGLGVKSHWVSLLPAMRKNSVMAIKQRLARSSPDAKRLMSRTWNEEGLIGLLKMAAGVNGWWTDAEQSKRFRSLEQLPKHTFGRTFFDHSASRGIPFPGEKKGIPVRMLHHDLMHVVNNYDTSPAGECELAGFYAGSTTGDFFTFIVVVLATFQLGLSVSPEAVVPSKGAFDPQRVLAAFIRGRHLRVDVMGPWNFWEMFPLKLDEVQRRLGLMVTAAEDTSANHYGVAGAAVG